MSLASPALPPSKRIYKLDRRQKSCGRLKGREWGEVKCGGMSTTGGEYLDGEGGNKTERKKEKGKE
jgi:hypothetical protein